RRGIGGYGHRGPGRAFGRGGAGDPVENPFSGEPESRLAGPGPGKAAIARLVRVIVTALAIVAGPGLASLVESPLAPKAPYLRGFQLRGSIAFNSDLGLCGSIR